MYNVSQNIHTGLFSFILVRLSVLRDVMYLPMFFRVASLALGAFNDNPQCQLLQYGLIRKSRFAVPLRNNVGSFVIIRTLIIGKRCASIGMAHLWQYSCFNFRVNVHNKVYTSCMTIRICTPFFPSPFDCWWIRWLDKQYAESNYQNK